MVFSLNPTLDDSPTKEIDVFYIIDVTSSMYGAKIEAVYKIVPELMNRIEAINQEHIDSLIAKVNILTFSDSSSWLSHQPILPAEMKDLWLSQYVHCMGAADYGLMFSCLERALHRGLPAHPSGQLNSVVGHAAPVVILVTESSPIDHWQDSLKKLKCNRWFEESIRIAIVMGNNPEPTVICEFASNNDSCSYVEEDPLDMAQYGVNATERTDSRPLVYHVHTIEQFYNTIKTVTSIATTYNNRGCECSIKPVIDRCLSDDIVNPKRDEIDDFDDWSYIRKDV